MTDDEAALVRAVEAEPGDETLRLVYADWLDDHGRAADAELVRLLCGRPLKCLTGVPEWFERHQGWAGPWDEQQHPLLRFIVWALDAGLQPESWPDPARRSAAISGIARRVVGLAQAHLPPTDATRQLVERAEADPAGVTSDGLAALLRGAADVWARYPVWMPDLAEPDDEHARQAVVIGWAWLGLPPAPAAPPRPVPVEPAPAAEPPRSWWRRLLGR